MRESFRLILDTPRPAALNMAIDEILMESQRLTRAFPVLRFYSWSGPAYSVGYFQNVAQIVKRFQCEKNGVPVVRRITGGGLVFHGEDLTFSIAAKSDHFFFAGTVKDSYLKINEVLRNALQKTYPKIDYADCGTIPSGRGTGERICFEAPSCFDLLLSGKKIVGASQRRKNGTVLHQSSVFLKGGASIATKLILDAFRKEHGIDFVEEPLSREELFLSEEKKANRYGSSEWAYLADLERSFFS